MNKRKISNCFIKHIYCTKKLVQQQLAYEKIILKTTAAQKHIGVIFFCLKEKNDKENNECCIVCVKRDDCKTTAVQRKYLRNIKYIERKKSKKFKKHNKGR